jgi:Skp family chaperone for outer membrane proteins
MLNKVLAVLCLIALGLSGYVFITMLQQPKVGVVDNAILLANFSEAITARKQFDGEKAKWDENTKAMEDSIKAALNEMTQKYSVSSKAQRKEMEERLQRWNSEYGRYTKSIKNLTAQKEQDILVPVVQKVNKIGRAHV